jgi:hypothetical protein
MNEWLAITPAGFFASSRRSPDVLSIVRGLQLISLAQVAHHLYRPDLVEQLVNGDPELKYSYAAHELNLEKIFDSGPAPQIELIRQPQQADEKVRFVVRIVDAGGGIGSELVWFVNGVRQEPDGVSSRAERGYRIAEQTLTIDPSRANTIEGVAFSGTGLLASLPLSMTFSAFGASEPQRMHILAIGVTKYADEALELQYGASDASMFAEALRQVASTFYEDVSVHTLLEGQVTRQGIADAFDEIRRVATLRARDVFVLYVAGHGRTQDGVYYFLPQDFKADSVRAVESQGIGQKLWVRWLGNVLAGKSFLVFDTCESATATALSGHEETAAIDRLSFASGRSVLTAGRQSAYEGYNGHGLLTHAVLEALSKSDTSTDDEVDVDQLVAYVKRRVPILSKEILPDTTLDEVQRPYSKSAGDYFRIGRRTLVFTASPDGAGIIPKAPTHQVVAEQGVLVREQPTEDAPGHLMLAQGTRVRVVDRVRGSWAVIAHDGQKLGFVPLKALSPI